MKKLSDKRTITGSRGCSFLDAAKPRQSCPATCMRWNRPILAWRGETLNLLPGRRVNRRSPMPFGGKMKTAFGGEGNLTGRIWERRPPFFFLKRPGFWKRGHLKGYFSRLMPRGKGLRNWRSLNRAWNYTRRCMDPKAPGVWGFEKARHRELSGTPGG